ARRRLSHARRPKAIFNVNRESRRSSEMPEGLRPSPRQSTATRPPFIHSLRAETVARVLGTYGALSDTSEGKPAARTEKYSSGHVVRRRSRDSEEADQRFGAHHEAA